MSHIGNEKLEFKITLVVIIYNLFYVNTSILKEHSTQYDNNEISTISFDSSDF